MTILKGRDVWENFMKKNRTNKKYLGDIATNTGYHIKGDIPSKK